MANEKKPRYELNTKLSLEFILASLTKEDYVSRIDSLVDGLSECDQQTIAILNKYKWLVETQLNGNMPSIPMLISEFPELSFNDVRPITNPEALSDYIFMYISKKRRSFISNKLMDIADKMKSQGITEEETLKLYDYLSTASSEDDYESITDNFEEIYKRQKKMEGISFLCNELDTLTGGITPGQVCTIMGAPGSMKTTYSSNIAYGAIKSGKNVLYVSLEEPALQLFSKWLSRCSIDAKCPIPQKDIVQKTIDDKQENDLYKKVVPLFLSYPGNLYVLQEQDLPDLTISTFESKFKMLDKAAKEETGHGMDLLVIDHVQLLKFAIDGMDTMTVINKYVSFFRQMSLSWLHEKRQVAVILLSQANREGIAFAQKNGGQYMAQHVAEASEIERASSYIISVYMDPMLQITNQLTLSAVKLRGSQMPPSVIPIYEDGSLYQVGVTNDSGSSIESSVDESHISLEDIDSMLGV